MATNPGDVGRRLSRVENDVASIYELLGDIQTIQGRHGAELARIKSKLLEHDARFDGIDTRLGGIDTQLGEINAGVTEIRGSLADLVRRLPPA